MKLFRIPKHIVICAITLAIGLHVQATPNASLKNNIQQLTLILSKDQNAHIDPLLERIKKDLCGYTSYSHCGIIKKINCDTFLKFIRRKQSLEQMATDIKNEIQTNVIHVAFRPLISLLKKIPLNSENFNKIYQLIQDAIKKEINTIKKHIADPSRVGVQKTNMIFKGIDQEFDQLIALVEIQSPKTENPQQENNLDQTPSAQKTETKAGTTNPSTFKDKKKNNAQQSQTAGNVNNPAQPNQGILSKLNPLNWVAGQPNHNTGSKEQEQIKHLEQTIKTTNEEKEKQVTNLKTQLATKDATISAQQKTNGDLTEKTKQLETDNTTLKKENTDLKAQLAEKDKEINTLKQQLVNPPEGISEEELTQNLQNLQNLLGPDFIQNIQNTDLAQTLPPQQNHTQQEPVQQNQTQQAQAQQDQTTVVQKTETKKVVPPVVSQEEQEQNFYANINKTALYKALETPATFTAWHNEQKNEAKKLGITLDLNKIKDETGGSLAHYAYNKGYNATLNNLFEDQKPWYYLYTTQYPVNINAQDNNGNTVLHLAAQKGDLDIITFLTSRIDLITDSGTKAEACSINITNNGGYTALDYAKHTNPATTTMAITKVLHSSKALHAHELPLTQKQQEILDQMLQPYTEIAGTFEQKIKGLQPLNVESIINLVTSAGTISPENQAALKNDTQVRIMLVKKLDDIKTALINKINDIKTIDSTTKKSILSHIKTYFESVVIQPVQRL
ncbi:MAG: ankyrin repeat domain-containing protein [bacterium]